MLHRLILSLLIGCAGAPADPAVQPTATADPEAIAQDAAAAIPGGQELTLVRSRPDALGMTHVRFQQRHHGIPVRGAEVIVHLDQNNAVVGITESLEPQLNVDPRVAVDEADAITLALDSLARSTVSDPPTAELQVLRRGPVDHLVWRVRIPQMDGTADADIPVRWVSAHTGEVVLAGTDLRHAAGPVTGTGVSNYSGTVDIDVYDDGAGTVIMEDTVRGIATYSAGNTTSSASIVTDSNTHFSASSQAEAVDGHYAAHQFFVFLDHTFGRDGLDGSGGPTYASSLVGSGSVFTVIVDYGYLQAQAAYATGIIYLGDGDGVNYGPMTSTDIVGHELGHGVNEDNAGFLYMDESGALDEHFADVYGAALERYLEGSAADHWNLGEDVYTPGVPGDAIRSMDDPTSDGVSVDHYDDRYTGTLDNGGVHVNSGIGNLAFVLVADGGNHPTDGGTAITGVSFDTALAIWHRAAEHYLTSSATYADARTATRTAARDLYGDGSAELEAVDGAWDLVGVAGASGCHTSLPGSYNYCTPSCPCDDGEGHCSDDTECDGGATCSADVGASHGYAWYVDVCEDDCHGSRSPGDGNYCTAACPCEDGEGGCTNDTQCSGDTVCEANVGASYGYAWYTDVCVSDCHGGASPGDAAYCSASCPCEDGEGQCTDDTECSGDTTCEPNVGASYGYVWYADVCVEDCHGAAALGAYNYCSTGCPCDVGEGQCADNTECTSGLTCVENAGAAHGLAWFVDVCE